MSAFRRTNGGPAKAGHYDRLFMRIARRYVISGRVQGVGFRYFTMLAAIDERIDGWVRNLPDGRVEAEAQGDSDAMRRFESKLRTGPRGSRVDDIDVNERAPSSEGAGFHVR